MLWSQSGQEKLATPRAKELLRAGIFDYDLIRTAYYLGMRNQDPELAILALQLRIKTWPDQATDGWLKLGHIYNSPAALDEQKALQAYQAAMQAGPDAFKPAVLAKVPLAYQAKVQ